jgi:HK97 family phage prohead protease
MRFYWPIAKVDGEQHMVWGYASTEAEDDQGETVSREALAAALEDYMRFANIREMHQPSAVGVATEAAVDDKGLYLGARIVDSDAWEKVVQGVYKGFSIGGRVTARDPADRRLITALHLTEISVVDRPANPEAIFDCWKLSTSPATGGSMATIAATTGAPVQIWDCGIAGHRHLAKAEAVRCLEGYERAAATATAPGEHGEDAAEDGGEGGGEVDYADPGYRPDGKKRYPIDTERHIRAAWAFIHQPGNARGYTAGQLDRIKVRIVAAWQEKIDRDGPPAGASEPGRAAEATRKGLAETGRLAQLIIDLDWLHDLIAIEAAIEADESPLAPRLQGIIAELCDFLQSLVAEDSAEPVDGSDGSAQADLAALAIAGDLAKARQPNFAPLANGLAKLAGEIVPRLDALQKRVDEIARTPLPPQTVARGFAGITKREDAGGTIPPAEDVVAALARMSDEERTLTLIKVAHANPIMPIGRPAGVATR